MTASLAWLDHDSAARDRSLRILALFREKETRDELGIGAVRDAIADQLFPGTSTIQTRLRYFLFVPWVYQRLENERVPPEAFAARARRLELELVRPLLANDDQAGVFGRQAGGDLKRLPSMVYWAGLGAWGIRRFDLSQDDYHRSIGQIYRRRDHRAGSDADDSDVNRAVVTWHPRLPPAPPGFPEAVSFVLTTAEAEFLLDRIVTSCPDSLLAHLALHGRVEAVEFPWEYPGFAGLRPDHQALLIQARRFSTVMHGAALLYNLLLAELEDLSDLVDGHREAFGEWAAGLDLAELRGWDLNTLWATVIGHGHTVTPATRRFVENWIRLAAGSPDGLPDHVEARELVRRRELALKQARSRFTNAQARKQWSGYAGLGRLAYRWFNAQRLLNDLHAALGRGA